ncbi:MAG: DUF3857 domain-containing protein [Bacteroidales bacterium]|jgi:tetratricopeptide (TPR) repeat protein|nr:DUF3857 domain-containing protein [Bacteroidales bacterium]
MNTKKISRIFLTSLFYLALFAGFAGNGKVNYQKAWNAFNENKREEAIHFFEMAVNEDDNAEQAYLSLALLYWNCGNDKKGLENFQQFYTLSENPCPYLYAMSTDLYVRPSRALSAQQLAFYLSILNDSRMDGTLRAMLLQEIGDYYRACNQIAKAKQYYAQIGMLTDWQVLGNFDNVSGSGFDKDWGAVAYPRANKVFKNKVNADVKWYYPGSNRFDGWFDFTYCFSLDDDIFYAQTFVNSPKNQDVILRIGVSGSMKFWLNDALIGTVEQERNCDMDLYAYKVHLQQGCNRLLIQIGQSEISDANFLVRLTDESGNPVKDITHSHQYADYQKNTSNIETAMLPFDVEVFFENKIRQEPDNLLNYIALANVYLHNDKTYEGLVLLKQAENKAERSSYIKEKLSEAYVRASNRTDYSRVIEFIKQNDPDAYLSLNFKFNELNEAEKYDEAEEILTKIIDIYGENKNTDYKKMEITANLKKIDELIYYARTFYAKYPYNSEYMRLNIAIEENVNNNTKAALSILTKYCKKYADMSAWEDLKEKYFQQGKTDKGLAVMQQKLQYMPYASGFRFDYAKILYRMQKYENSLTVMEELKMQIPYISDVYNMEGYIYKQMKNNPKAKENFEKAVYYSPTDYDSRTQIRLLENKKEVFDLFPTADLKAQIAKNVKQEDYKEENADILMYDVQNVFYPEGAQEHRIEFAVKMLNQSAIEEWKEYQIPYYNIQRLSLEKYEIIKPNGQKVKAETNQNGTIVFTNLETGDILHLLYRLQDYRAGALSNHIFDFAPLQYSIPATYIRHAILLPKNKTLQYMVKNSDLQPKISQTEDMTLYEWIVENQPAIKDEPLMPPFADVAPTLIYSTIPDWKFVSNWYKDATANKFNTEHDFIFKEAYNQIITGNENASAMQKAQLFYEYILNNITYSQVSFLQSNIIPQKPSRTLTTRLGDCKDVSTLFVAFCRQAGIDANLVLLQGKDKPSNALALPANSFDHCIAQMNLDNKTYYLELTNAKLPFCAALEEDLHANILPIPYKNETSTAEDISKSNMGNQLIIMEMPQRKLNEIIRQQNITIDGNNLKSIYRSSRTGQMASFSRYNFANLGNEERLKQINQSFAADWSIPVKISNLEFINLNNLEDSVHYNCVLDANGALQDVAGMKIFKMPWTDAITSMPEITLPERKYPFAFWQYIFCDKEFETITLHLPDGKQLAEKPTDCRLECPVAIYELTFDTSTKGKIIAKRTFAKKKDILEPSEYAQYQEFIKKVSESDNKQIAIK